MRAQTMSTMSKASSVDTVHVGSVSKWALLQSAWGGVTSPRPSARGSKYSDGGRHASRRGRRRSKLERESIASLGSLDADERDDP